MSYGNLIRKGCCGSIGSPATATNSPRQRASSARAGALDQARTSTTKTTHHAKMLFSMPPPNPSFSR